MDTLIDNNTVEEVKEKMKVIGVGSAGGNAVEYMAKMYKREAAELERAEERSSYIDEMEFIAISTNEAELKHRDGELMRCVRIGENTFRGRVEGDCPEVNAIAAWESREDIEKALEGAFIVIIVAGMGGGTGTGAAPVVASIARNMKILTLGIVTKPFVFEREYKLNKAIKGIKNMRGNVDSLIVVPNEKLLNVIKKENPSYKQTLAMVDDILFRTVKAISDLIYKEGVIGIAFSDLSLIFSDSDYACVLFGTGRGENKVKDTVSQIINNPLLEAPLSHVSKMILCVTLTNNSKIDDFKNVLRLICEPADPSMIMIPVVHQDISITDDIISVTVIASGFKESDDIGGILTDERFDSINEIFRSKTAKDRDKNNTVKA